jgi:hypothetical protein
MHGSWVTWVDGAWVACAANELCTEATPPERAHLCTCLTQPSRQGTCFLFTATIQVVQLLASLRFLQVYARHGATADNPVATLFDHVRNWLAQRCRCFRRDSSPCTLTTSMSSRYPSVWNVAGVSCERNA